MKTKTLAQVAGIIGTIAGTLLAILPVIILMIVPIFENEDFTGVILAIIFIVFTLVKIATLILGILSLIYYKDDKRISMAPSILLIVGSVVGLIPFLGWIGGIVIVIGGALFLTSLKQFQVQEQLFIERRGGHLFSFQSILTSFFVKNCVKQNR